MICTKCVVVGRVQGVWYRASTQQIAEQLGVTGYARNLPNGDVEVLACGSDTAVEQLKQWLRQGPDLARVDQVLCEVQEDPHPPQHFKTM